MVILMLKSWEHNVATQSLTRCHVRLQSTALHFYQNQQLDRYASKEAKRLTLRQLVHFFVRQPYNHSHIVDWQVFFGRSMDAERLIKALGCELCSQAIQLTILFTLSAECKLCSHRTGCTHCSPTKRYASLAICCGHTRRAWKGLWGPFGPRYNIDLWY